MDFRSASIDMMFNLVVPRDELIKWRQTFSAERKLPCMNMNIGIYNWEHRSQTALIWYYVQVGRYFGIRWKMHSRMKRRMQHIFYMDTIDEVFGIKGASVYKAEEGGL